MPNPNQLSRADAASKVRQQTFPYLEKVSMNVPPLQDALCGLLAQLHQCWKVGQDWVHIKQTQIVFKVSYIPRTLQAYICTYCEHT